MCCVLAIIPHTCYAGVSRALYLNALYQVQEINTNGPHTQQQGELYLRHNLTLQHQKRPHAPHVQQTQDKANLSHFSGLTQSTTFLISQNNIIPHT